MLEGRNLMSTFMVDHLADDLVGDGLNGSLRYCINQASDGDTIQFGVTGTINLTGALPNLTHSISIDGPGADELTVRRDTGGDYRVLFVTGGATVHLEGLTVSNGHITSNGGSGLYVYQANLTADRIVLSGNTTTDTVNGGPGLLLDTGTVTISNSAIVNNTSAGVGGGVYNFFGGHLTLENTTISGNTAAGWDGGAIWTYAPLTLVNCTVANNHAVRGGGIAVRTSTTVSLRNTIVAGNTASIGDPDLSGPLASSGYNVIGNTQGGSGFDATDLLNVDPLLGPLQDNGGPSPTLALLAGSPALNAGDPAQLGVADQRGVVRSGGVNIGAYQASASALAVTAPDTTTAGGPFDVTVTAVDTFGQTALGYTGLVTFTSADPYGATLPADYPFVAADHGTHTFSNGATLYTTGNWDVTVTDTATGSITGSAFVAVTSAAADHLMFLQQPTDTAAGQTITPAVTVAIVDQFGNVVSSDNTDTVTLAIGVNPSGGTLSGTLTLTVSGGMATFSDLAIDLAGDGYTLHATTLGLTDADSAAFHIT
jgi:hypothetical protein